MTQFLKLLAIAGLAVSATMAAAQAGDGQPVTTALVSLASASTPDAAVAQAVAGPSGATASCTGQAWPYVARECLAAADGTPARKVVRVIGAR